MYVLVGAGTAVVALWRRRLRGPVSAPSPAVTPPLPHDAGILIASMLTALRDAEEAIRSLRDSNLDTQISLASQIEALRELVEDIQSTAKTLRRLVAKVEEGRRCPPQ